MIWVRVSFVTIYIYLFPLCMKVFRLGLEITVDYTWLEVQLSRWLKKHFLYKQKHSPIKKYYTRKYFNYYIYSKLYIAYLVGLQNFQFITKQQFKLLLKTANKELRWWIIKLLQRLSMTGISFNINFSGWTCKNVQLPDACKT